MQFIRNFRTSRKMAQVATDQAADEVRQATTEVVDAHLASIRHSEAHTWARTRRGAHAVVQLAAEVDHPVDRDALAHAQWDPSGHIAMDRAFEDLASRHLGNVPGGRALGVLRWAATPSGARLSVHPRRARRAAIDLYRYDWQRSIHLVQTTDGLYSLQGEGEPVRDWPSEDPLAALQEVLDEAKAAAGIYRRLGHHARSRLSIVDPDQLVAVVQTAIDTERSCQVVSQIVIREDLRRMAADIVGTR